MFSGSNYSAAPAYESFDFQPAPQNQSDQRKENKHKSNGLQQKLCSSICTTITDVSKLPVSLPLLGAFSSPAAAVSNKLRKCTKVQTVLSHLEKLQSMSSCRKHLLQATFNKSDQDQDVTASPSCGHKVSRFEVAAEISYKFNQIEKWKVFFPAGFAKMAAKSQSFNHVNATSFSSDWSKLNMTDGLANPTAASSKDRCS